MKFIKDILLFEIEAKNGASITTQSAATRNDAFGFIYSIIPGFFAAGVLRDWS
jgi:hypothetical protein